MRSIHPGGDFLKGDGTGSFSIYGDKFPVRHRCHPAIALAIDPAPRMRTSRRNTLGLVSYRWYGVTPAFLSIAISPLFSQANSGPNTNGCQFFITTAKCDFLDGKHVVFGRVIDGMLTLRKIENVPTGPNNRPKLAVKIVG